jgi:hypothetical protein
MLDHLDCHILAWPAPLVHAPKAARPDHHACGVSAVMPAAPDALEYALSYVHYLPVLHRNTCI